MPTSAGRVVSPSFHGWVTKDEVRRDLALRAAARGGFEDATSSHTEIGKKIETLKKEFPNSG